MDIQKELKDIFLVVFPSLDASNFTLDKPRTEFENWDSLSHLQLVSEIESKFKINFEMTEIVEIEKGSDFLPLIESKIRKHEAKPQ